MNRNGQSAVIFIILVPVFLLLAVIILDTGINMHSEKKLKNVTEDVLELLLSNEDLENVSYENEEEVLEELREEAVRFYENNEIDTSDVYIELSYGQRIIITNIHRNYSLANSLLGKGDGKRQIRVKAEGYLDDGELVVEFKDGSNDN